MVDLTTLISANTARLTSANTADIQRSIDQIGLGQSRYNFTNRVFPEDLAND